MAEDNVFIDLALMVLIGVIIILSFDLVSATSFGYNILDNEIVTGTGNTYYNVTNITNYYNQSVNATTDETQFTSSYPITIDESWLTSFINSFGFLDDFTELDTKAYNGTLAYSSQIINWNSTGLIQNWNASGWLKNWAVDIGLANTSAINWVTGQNYITNATMNKTVSCSNIIGSPDTDFCTDATGGASGLIEWANDTTTLYNTTSNSVWTEITALKTTLAPNSNYSIKCWINDKTVIATTGTTINVTTTGSPVVVLWILNTQVSATTRTSFKGVATTSNILADTGSAGVNINDISFLSGYIQTNSNPVVLNYYYRSEITNSWAVIDIGSDCRYRKVN